MRSNPEAVARLHPDYLGFIFWEPSSRYFEGKIGAGIKIPKIGVFVDSQLQEVLEVVDRYSLEGVQLHGDETPEYCDMLRNHLKELDDTLCLIKAFQVSPDFNFEILHAYEGKADYFLFDAKGRLPGGNSIRFDWELLQKYYGKTPYFLSGGIGPEDLGRIRAFLEDPVSDLCHAIDINSRFERSPGMKNIENLRSFITSIRDIETASK